MPKKPAFFLVALGLICAQPGRLSAGTLAVAREAFVRGGAYAAHDMDEAATNYLHVKHSTGLDTARKCYLQFDLNDPAAALDAPAMLTVKFTVSNKQRVQLWGLNQDVPGFNSGITWVSAPANDPASNLLLTNGPIQATPIGTNTLVPVSGTVPANFSLPRLGDFVFGHHVTLVLTGVEDTNNNAGGLRMVLHQSTLSYSSTSNPPPVTPTHYDVYLVGGQSNMDGRGRNNELTNELAAWNAAQPEIRIYYANPGSATTYSPTPAYDTGWQTLAPGFAVAPGYTGGIPSPNFGPELSFARALADANPARHLALIKVTKGGTSLSGDWNPSGGYLYATFTNRVQAALAALTNATTTTTLRGMIWHQGESDSSGAAEANYKANMVTLIQTVRRDLGSANLPFVIGEIATNKSVIVRGAQRDLAEELPYVGFASADGLRTYEGTHFITADVIELGRRFAANLRPPPLRLNQVTPSALGVGLAASGPAGAPCQLRASSAVSLPRQAWQVLSSHWLDAAGNLRLTNPVTPGWPQQFFALEPL